MKALIHLFLIAVLCNAAFGLSVIMEKEKAAAVIVKGNTAFAFDLYEQLKDTEGNLFFSPYSISTAMAMTYEGAEKENP